MQIRSGNLSFGALAAGVFLFGLIAMGHATWAMQNGASPDDEGIAAIGPSGSSRRSTHITLQNQQFSGGIAMVLGAAAVGLSFVLPLMMREDEE